MKKIGAGHVEIILSFIIFIAAIGFGLYFFNTGNSSRVIDSTMSYAIREIIENSSSKIEIFFVDVNGSKFSGQEIALNFSGVVGNTSVINYDGEILDSSRGGENRELVYIRNTWDEKEAIYVIFSEEIEEDSLAKNAEHNETYYEIGSSEERKVVSEKKISDLVESYNRDYRKLKGREQFNLPDRADFGFSLVFNQTDSIVAENKIPDNMEVFSGKRRVEVLRRDGSLVFAELIVKVW